jgi:hypothetical protein
MSSISVAGDSSGSITIAAPAVAGSGTLTLPVATDTLIGKATTDTLTNKSIAATQLTGTIAAAALPAGSVLQVVSTTKTDTFTSTAATTWTDITGLTVSITPRSTSNKILVNFSPCGTSPGNNLYVRLMRDATPICVGDTSGTRTSNSAGNFYNPGANAATTFIFSNLYLDSPSSVSSIVYKLQFWQGAAGTAYFNRAQSDADSSQTPRGASTITVQEIAG